MDKKEDVIPENRCKLCSKESNYWVIYRESDIQYPVCENCIGLEIYGGDVWLLVNMSHPNIKKIMDAATLASDLDGDGFPDTEFAKNFMEW